ncbi:MAG: hypothetical protein R2864_04110 [Syntrophotaleaceae bacterium]
MPEELAPLLVEAEEIRKEMVVLQGEASALQEKIENHANPS